MATDTAGQQHWQAHERMFRRRFFPAARARDWRDWRWHLRRRLTTAAAASEVLGLSAAEQAALAAAADHAPMAITPHYAAVLTAGDAAVALRRTVLPSVDERCVSPGEWRDPLDEDAHRPVPAVVHRYPDRALFLTGTTCAVSCRYCTRSRLTGKTHGDSLGPAQWAEGVQYIARTPAIRDVLVSGGEPLLFADEQLAGLLSALHDIAHVEMIRIGTKAPMALPQRITPALCRMLRRFQPLYISIHATHPAELTPPSMRACARLADAGMVLGSQTVLLRGVNDNAETIRELMHGLLRARVRPYYLLQCDPVEGSVHFRTPVSTGIGIIRALRGHTSGYAVPHFIIDAPGGGGKVALEPEYICGRDSEALLIRNYEGRRYTYPDPVRR